MSTREIPASTGQRLLWFLDHYRGVEGALNCPVLCRLRGPLDRRVLEASLVRLTERHESLRTTFVRRGRRILQCIHPPHARGAELVVRDLSGADTPELALTQSIAIEQRTTIDPTVWPVRVTLFRVSDADHVLCINMHHLVADAWSTGIVFRDLRFLFERESGGSRELPPCWQYSQFCDWEQSSLTGAELKAHQNYWRTKLAGARPTALPGDPLSAREQRRTGRHSSTIAETTTTALREYARTHRTSHFSVMLAIYYTMIQRRTSQTDISVASLFANRSRPEAQTTVGFIARMALLRVDLAGVSTFDDIVRRVHTTVMDAFLHQALPFQMLPADVLESDQGRADDVVFQMTAEPMTHSTMGELEVEMMVPDGLGTRFELELVLVLCGSGIRAVLFYNEARVPSEFARRFLEDYTALACEMAERHSFGLHPQSTVSDPSRLHT